jgi:hypothetical protein
MASGQKRENVAVKLWGVCLAERKYSSRNVWITLLMKTGAALKSTQSGLRIRMDHQGQALRHDLPDVANKESRL